MKKPSIQQIENFFPPETAHSIADYAYFGTADGPGYRYGEGDGVGEDLPTGLVMDLYHEEQKENVPITEDVRSIYNNFINHIDQKYPGFWNDYRIYRLYINVFSPRELAYFHRDCEGETDQWTFLYYPIPDFEWELNEGGWTEFDLDSKIIGVLPLPNSIVRFTSSINHRATPFRNRHRFSIALKCVNKNERRR